MNMYSKLALGTLCASLVLASAFAITGVHSPGSPDPSPAAPKSAQSSEGHAAKNTIEISQSEEYCLILEGNLLCAYKMQGGQRELIRSENAQPMLMSEAEVRTLERGIYAQSFEDLCLYFESYLS
ncbi:MAG: hypothetical protein IKA95_02750 [Clostridia bacterium]|nr:hypothetical protein [Clostridia bacterium]